MQDYGLPSNNFLGFQIFVSFLSFFKTIGARKFLGILSEFPLHRENCEK